MQTTRSSFGGREAGPAVALVVVAGLFSTLWWPARAQQAAPHEIGVVYYADGAGFKALTKETAPEGGRPNYSARVKGAHAAVRLPAGQPQVFRVCGVDPTRYKLFTFKSSKNSRSVTLAKINMWVGGSKSVLSESEVAVAIQPAEAGCFTITPKEALKDGEFGFSPAGAEDVFMFGVGEVRQGK